MRTAALIVAAGRGDRMGGAVPKQFLELAGGPLLAWCIQRFCDADGIDEIVVALRRPADLARHLGPWMPWPVPVSAVQGGDTRQASVAAALEATRTAPDLVVVHDGARPLVPPRLIREVVKAAAAVGAAVAAEPCTDTVKEVRSGRVRLTLDRTHLVLTQTPQAFRADLLREAHQQAVRDQFTGTDDAALVERLGRPVVIVKGDPSNLKITTTRDLALAELLLEQSAERQETG